MNHFLLLWFLVSFQFLSSLIYAKNDCIDLGILVIKLQEKNHFSQNCQILHQVPIASNQQYRKMHIKFIQVHISMFIIEFG
jgi:hypothetical protein